LRAKRITVGWKGASHHGPFPGARVQLEHASKRLAIALLNDVAAAQLVGREARHEQDLELLRQLDRVGVFHDVVQIAPGQFLQHGLDLAVLVDIDDRQSIAVVP
jgi:hypothetical protein